MSVGTLQPSVGRPGRPGVVTATPPRLRPKGPLGPEFYRRSPAEASGPKQSAVERLEADKSKYVKSPVALSKQRPVGPPVMRKPLLSPGTALRPTRKTPLRPVVQQLSGASLDLEHLSNLINGVSDADAPLLSPTSDVSLEKDEATKHTTTTTTITTTPSNSPCTSLSNASRLAQPEVASGTQRGGTDWSSPAKVRIKGPLKMESSMGSPAAVTVRRVDVMPHTRPTRTPCRAQQPIRPPLHPMPSHSPNQMHTITSNLRFFYSRANPGPLSPLKPVAAPPTHRVPSPPAGSPAASPAPALPTPTHPAFPPPSPAFTRLSSCSSRKRPSLTRSKSDMSDRCSRAGTDMERFFNLCGLDPTELEVLTGPGSDIVSIARFRSASAPGSECAGSGPEEEEEEGNEVGRAPYGVSVIERNARVIKWLYGIRQAKDTARSTNM
ncbi:protein FAM110A [Aplochiton taeniatus]